MKPVTDWEKRYQDGSTGWDLGAVSTPLKEYFDQLENRDLKILVPGAGNAYEAAYLHENGFTNVYVLDLAPSPLKNFQLRFPDFPKGHLIEGNFFEHNGDYDIIIEQTFFCAIDPKHRLDYAKKSHSLLKEKGKLVGLFWSVEMNSGNPPFGGNKEEYLEYFHPYFNIMVFESANNSIAPRAGRELFLIAKRKTI